MSYSQAKGRQWRWKLLELWRRFDRSFRRESTRRRFFFVMSFVSAIGLFAFLLYTVDYLNEASPRREYDDLQLQIRRKNIQTHIRERLSSASTAAAEKNCSSAFRAFDHEKYPECEEKLFMELTGPTAPF
uniref:Uncharacterized protein n=1 Tax=Steinernema glaseri TaxID=37863 RepID=A0A1I7ZLV0_9BILA